MHDTPSGLEDARLGWRRLGRTQLEQFRGAGDDLQRRTQVVADLGHEQCARLGAFQECAVGAPTGSRMLAPCQQPAGSVAAGQPACRRDDRAGVPACCHDQPPVGQGEAQQADPGVLLTREHRRQQTAELEGQGGLHRASYGCQVHDRRAQRQG